MSSRNPVERVSSPSISLLPVIEQEQGIAQIPAPQTSLVGRDREITTIHALLNPAGGAGVRLLTLTGPGGVGKTRLALHVAAALDRADTFPDGIAFVPLAALLDPDLVLPEISRALRLRESPDEPVRDRLFRSLACRRVLLILDNFEQVVDAAPCVTDLLVACPRLTVLVTSRQALPISAQHRFPVPPLALPPQSDPASPLSVAELAAIEAVDLFAGRAAASDPSFTLTPAIAPVVAEICRRLDGLPLAIELAAARCRLLSPAALLARLEHRLPLLSGGSLDLPARHRTLRATIAWSYNLLDPDEQSSFRELSVCTGGIALDCVERGLSAAPSALDAVASLIDKSLIQRMEQADGADTGPRFVMLETIREFGLEQLELHGETAIVRRTHAQTFLALAEEASAYLTGSQKDVWLNRLAREQDNLRAALSWAVESGEVEMAARLAAALWPFWRQRFHVAEGRGWLTRVLQPGDRIAPGLRAKALVGAGTLAWVEQDYEAARARFAEALTLARAVDDAAATGQALLALGRLAADRGNQPGARSAFDAALSLFQQRTDEAGIANSLHGLALVAHNEGDGDLSAALFDDALRHWRELGRPWGLSCCIHGHLGDIARAQGDIERATALYRESLILNHDHGHTENLSWLLIGLAAGAMHDRNGTLAARLLGAAGFLREALDAPLRPGGRADYESLIPTVRAHLGDGAFASAFAAGRALSTEDAVAEALAPDPEPARLPSATCATAPNPHHLSRREIEVLELLVAGQANQEIADTLFISVPTVKVHVRNVLAKLGVPTRSAAAALAYQQGLV
ncbi:MAG: tetratricopeptide repeat protein [Chloroflexia bacterium]|nr:tetratricopeptide repeat protein [Chloroflexia bacterium]